MSPDKGISRNIQTTFKKQAKQPHGRKKRGQDDRESFVLLCTPGSEPPKKRVASVITLSDDSDQEASSPRRSPRQNPNQKLYPLFEPVVDNKNDTSDDDASDVSSFLEEYGGSCKRKENVVSSDDSISNDDDEDDEDDDDDTKSPSNTVPVTVHHRYHTRSRRSLVLDNEGLRDEAVPDQRTDIKEVSDTTAKDQITPRLTLEPYLRTDGLDASTELSNVEENERLHLFESVQNLFSANDNMTMHERSEAFFADYDLIPLFVQENYLNVVPEENRDPVEHLQLISTVADFISWSDITDHQIRRDQNWTLMTEMAMFSTVLPTKYLQGTFRRRVKFPVSLRKLKKYNRSRRLVQLQMQAACRSSVGTNTADWILDYAPSLRLRTTQPLLQRKCKTNDAVSAVLETMDRYAMTLEDRETLLSLTKWPRQEQRKVSKRKELALINGYHEFPRKVIHAVDEMENEQKVKARSADAVSDIEQDVVLIS